MASRKASRTVIVAISAPAGSSGWGWISGLGGAASADFGCAGGLAAIGATAGGADSAARSWRAGLPPSTLSVAASSPSAKIIAIGVLTATSLVPSGTRILPSVPSSTASTSIVALSVSISATTSPALTASPSFLSHMARLPFSIVGERAGIKIGVGMGGARSGLRPAVGVHVGIELTRSRFGFMGSEFRRLVNPRPHLLVDLPQRLFSRELFRDQACAHLLNVIVLGADFVDFLLRPVLGGIRH